MRMAMPMVIAVDVDVDVIVVMGGHGVVSARSPGMAPQQTD